MVQLIREILQKIGDKLAAVLLGAVEAAKSFFEYKNRKLESEKEKTAEKAKDKARNTIVETVDKGTMEDLLDLKSKVGVLVLAAGLLSAGGCVSEKIELTPTRQWEGHFMKQQDAQNAIWKCRLEKGESIWILSNATLKRVLLEKGDLK